MSAGVFFLSVSNEIYQKKTYFNFLTSEYFFEHF